MEHSTRPAKNGSWAPSRPIEFVVGAGAGGGSDQLARTVQSIVQKHQLVDASVIVTNKGGGSGSEAFVYAKGAAGDPHKMVFATNNVWILPLGSAVGYAWSDLQPVAAMAFDECVFSKTRLTYRDAVTASQAWSDIPPCMEAGLPIEKYQMPRTVWLPKGVTDEQVFAEDGWLVR